MARKVRVRRVRAYPGGDSRIAESIPGTESTGSCRFFAIPLFSYRYDACLEFNRYMTGDTSRIITPPADTDCDRVSI